MCSHVSIFFFFFLFTVHDENFYPYISGVVDIVYFSSYELFFSLVMLPLKKVSGKRLLLLANGVDVKIPK